MTRLRNRQRKGLRLATPTGYDGLLADVVRVIEDARR
jgi:hypothetical protein